MSKSDKIKWNGLLLTPEQYEEVKDTIYISEPTNWEIQCTNDAINCVVAYCNLLATFKLDDYYSPEASSDLLKDITDDLFKEAIVQKAFDYDEVEIAQSIELLCGISNAYIEQKTIGLLSNLIKDLNDIMFKMFH